VKGCTDPESTCADSLKWAVFFSVVLITGSPDIRLRIYCRSDLIMTDGCTSAGAEYRKEAELFII
ncbi:hypothetical protein, partial [Pseudomonas syringae]|uniref:hypothetical protein n=1 Tax=Pseudomonas syringae TaxID=317 RepID=UPI001F3A45B6